MRNLHSLVMCIPPKSAKLELTDFGGFSYCKNTTKKQATFNPIQFFAVFIDNKRVPNRHY